MTASDLIPTLPKNLDQLLADFGLQKRHSSASYVLPVLGIFAAGAVVGGLLALMLAPSSGEKLRSDIEKKLRPGPTDHSKPATHLSTDPGPEDHQSRG